MIHQRAQEPSKGLWSFPGGRIRFHYIVNYVRARHLSGEPRARADAAQVRWATEAEIPHLTMHPVARKTALRLLRETEESAP